MTKMGKKTPETSSFIITYIVRYW